MEPLQASPRPCVFLMRITSLSVCVQLSYSAKFKMLYLCALVDHSTNYSGCKEMLQTRKQSTKLGLAKRRAEVLPCHFVNTSGTNQTKILPSCNLPFDGKERWEREPGINNEQTQHRKQERNARDGRWQCHFTKISQGRPYTVTFQQEHKGKEDIDLRKWNVVNPVVLCTLGQKCACPTSEKEQQVAVAEKTSDITQSHRGGTKPQKVGLLKVLYIVTQTMDEDLNKILLEKCGNSPHLWELLLERCPQGKAD